MSNYSNKSANNPCQRCLDKKVIYLTFDDGPEPGTLDIYNKLNEIKIPATFFFVGENVIASETGALNISHNQTIAPGFFKKVFDNPLFQIGNHSQTQSHQFYDSYYEKGLKIDQKTLAPSATTKNEGRRSVLVDFELANVAFTHALDRTPNKYFEDRSKILDYGYRGDDVSGLFSKYEIVHFRFLAARMPGTNEWRLDGAENSLLFGGVRDDEADDLAKNKYKIYGWDIEWKMTNVTYQNDSRKNHKSVMSIDVLNEHNNNEDGWWDGYYNESNVNDDRLKVTADKIFSMTRRKLSRCLNCQCVILMHDRQFRTTPDGSNPYIEELAKFIQKCQQEGYKFDVLENYQS
jgi:peptidoglycan/xylan/chitin deacetylase (PgdA/CDA1 family)